MRTAKHAKALTLGGDPWSTLAIAALRLAVADARRGDEEAAAWLLAGGSDFLCGFWNITPESVRWHLKRGGLMQELDASHISRWVEPKVIEAVSQSHSVRITLDVSAGGVVRGSTTVIESILPAVRRGPGRPPSTKVG